MKSKLIVLNLLVALFSVALMTTSADAACLVGATVKTTFEQTICPGTGAARKADKSADFSISGSYPGCTTSGSGTPGTSPISGGSGGGGYTQTGGGGSAGGSSPSIISQEDCFAPIGGAGTAGGDNGNSGPTLNGFGGAGGIGDSGCGGDESSTCNKCEKAVKDVGSYAIFTNGTYTFDHEDLRIPGRGGMDVLLRRVYRSNRIIDKPTGPVFAEPADDIFGFGWSTPLTVKIVNGDTYVDASGRYFTFKKDDAGNFLADAKSGLALKQIANGFILNKLDAYIRTFDVNGKLLTKSDNYGNTWKLNYNAEGLLSEVIDPAGRTALTFTYNSENRVDTVFDLASRSVSYGYDAIGNLIRYTDPTGNDYVYEYNSYHGITSKSNPLNETFKITYRYADKGVVASVMDPIGSQLLADGNSVEAEKYKISFQYDFQNKTFYSTDKSGRQVKQTVNGEGKVTSSVVTATGKTVKTVEYLSDRTEKTTDAVGNVTLSKKDEWGNVLRRVDPEGNERSYTYTKGNRLLSATDPEGTVTRYSYNDKGKIIREVRAEGTELEVAIEAEFNSYGQLISQTRGGASYRYSYDEVGNQTSIIDPLGNETTMEYDVAGNQIEFIYPNGNSAEYVYNELNNLVTATNPLGNITRYSYNNAGRSAKVVDSSGRETFIETDFEGRTTAVIDARGFRREMEYDGEGNVISITQGSAITRFNYDSEGRLIEVIDPLKYSVSYEYNDEASCFSCEGSNKSKPSRIFDTFGQKAEIIFDKNGKITGTKDPLQNLSNYIYDRRGKIVRQIDSNGNATQYEYDYLGRISKQTNAEGGVTSFSYDLRNDLVGLTDSEGNISMFVYDLMGNRIKEIDPLGRVTTYTYTANGLIETLLDSKGQLTTFTYDVANQLVQVEYADHSKDVFGYDVVGNLVLYSSPSVSGTFVYDELNRKTMETVDFGSFTKTFRYTYDDRGNKASYISPELVENIYNWQLNDQLASVVVNNKTFTFVYDNNRLENLVFPNGVVTTYGYNENSWITEISTSGPTGNIYGSTYSYDGVGNIIKKVSGQGAYTYQYDKTYQLISSDNPTLTDESFTYDKAGNRLTSADTIGTWTYNENNELISDTRAIFEYDANGNLTKKIKTDDATTYHYNSRNRLERVDLPSGQVALYSYDPFGRRILKQIGNDMTYFVYSDEGLIGEYDQSGLLMNAYYWKPKSAWGSDPLYTLKNDEIYYFHNDHLFTPQIISNDQGAVVWDSVYLAYGRAEINPTLSTIDSSFRLPGQYLDRETNIHYNKNRFYDPDTGRYLQIDPIKYYGGDYNLYRYVGNSPNNLYDPLGLMAFIKCTRRLSENRN